VKEIDQLPIKMVHQSPVRIADIGYAKDGHEIQTNIVRVDGQRSVYVPVLKQGGDTNTIAVVDGIKESVLHLFDVPKELVTKVVFDQSLFVKTAIETLLHEGGIGLVLTSIMILIFLGSMRLPSRSFSPSRFRLWQPSLPSRWAEVPSTAWCWAAWRWPSRA